MKKLLWLLLLPAWVSAQTLPRVNLWVELRWVEAGMSEAVLSGVREGATVTGTAGSVSPRGALVLGSTTRQHSTELMQPVLVVNGSTAAVHMSEPAPAPSVELQVQTGPDGRVQRAYASPRAAPERQRGYSLTPSWPGGAQPARVELKLQDGSATPGVQSTVLVPLGSWVTVLRSGASTVARERGSWNSHDAEPRPGRELQVRLQLAPDSMR